MKSHSIIIAIASIAIVQSCSGSPECVDYWKSYVSRRVSSDISELLQENAENADYFYVSPFGEDEYYKKQAIAFYIESLEGYKYYSASEEETDEKWSDPEAYIKDRHVISYYKVKISDWNNKFYHETDNNIYYLNEEDYGDGMQEAIDFLNYSYEHPDVTVSNLLKIIPSFEDADNYMASKCSVIECEKNTNSSNRHVDVYEVIYLVQGVRAFYSEEITDWYVLADVSVDENGITEIKILKQEKNLIDLLR